MKLHGLQQRQNGKVCFALLLMVMMYFVACVRTSIPRRRFC